MAYYRPDGVGGYPIETGLGEDGPSEYGAVNPGFRPGREYVQQGYGAPRYEYEPGRPLGGEYVGGAPEYYGPERPGGYGYGQEGYGREGYGREGYGREGYGREGYGQEGYGREGYGREGYGREGYGREGYGPSAYNQGYPARQQIRMESPIEYIEVEASDLGMGIRDSRNSRYEAEYGRPELDGYGRAPGYGGATYEDDEVRRLRRELEHEKRRTHELELETGAAVAYGLHERHEKEDVEDEEKGLKGKKHHHFFGRD